MKVAVESYVEMYARERGLRPVILRPSNAYGERQGLNGADGAVSVLMRCASRGEGFHMWGDGSVVRDFLHVADLARACVAAAESGVTGSFNLGSGTGTSLLDLIEMVAQVTGRPIAVNRSGGRTVDAPVSILDVQAIRAALGWEAQIPLREGLRRTWEWQQSLPG